MGDENQVDVKDEVAELAPFDPTKKKKKVVIQETPDDYVDKLAEKTETLTVSEGIESPFTGLKKKKKKQVETSLLNEESGDAGEDLDDHTAEDDEGEGIALQHCYPWEGSDRDYGYEELLGRVFNILRENNPELAGDRRRIVLRPPHVRREGVKKTVFVNFMNICRYMHRQPDHVMAFLLSELGTSGSLDGQQRLVVKGRFASKHFASILRQYMNILLALGAKVLTQSFQRRIVSSFSDARCVARDDQLLLLKLVSLLVLALETMRTKEIRWYRDGFYLHKDVMICF